MTAALIIGSGSTIGRAFAEHLARRGLTVWTVARDSQSYRQNGVREITCPYTEPGMAAATRQLLDAGCQPAYVGIFPGILHGPDTRPEKRLEDLEMNQLQRVLTANSIVPALWLKHLLPVLNQGQDCRVAVLSARVGSIGDNRLGGWYAYRSSKAALNMLLKTTAVEFARRAPAIKLIAFHPGTTDTPLSKPFQGNVPPERLFSPEAVAEKLFRVLEQHAPDGELAYLDHAGQEIPW